MGNKIFYTVVFGVFILSTALHCSTFIPSIRDNGLIGMGWTFPLFIAMFATFFKGITSVNKATGGSGSRISFNQVFPYISWKWKVGGAVLMAYVMFNFFYSLTVLTGGVSTKYEDGKYLLHSKGSIIEEIDETTYHRHNTYEFRGMSGHIVLFSFASMMMMQAAVNIQAGKEEEN